MTTATNDTATLRLSQEDWLMIREQIPFHAGAVIDLEHALVDLDRSRVVELRDLASWAIRMLDAIGWEETAEDPVEIDVNADEWKEWLLSARRDSESEIGRLVVTLAAQERGEELHYYDDDQASSIEKTRGYIARETKRVETFNGLFKQLNPNAVI